MAPTIHLLRTILPRVLSSTSLSLEFWTRRSGSGHRSRPSIGVHRFGFAKS